MICFQLDAEKYGRSTLTLTFTNISSGFWTGNGTRVFSKTSSPPVFEIVIACTVRGNDMANQGRKLDDL